MKNVMVLCLLLSVCVSQLFCAPRVYFSPDGDIQGKIIECIDQSSESIDVMCFNFTSRALAKSLLDAKKRGVRVRVILDFSQTQDSNTMYRFFKKNHMEVKRMSSPKNGIMHNKVAIFDTKTALTGSYNWTESAEHYNYENAVFLDDKQAIFDYKQQFKSLWDTYNNNPSGPSVQRSKKSGRYGKARKND